MSPTNEAPQRARLTIAIGFDGRQGGRDATALGRRLGSAYDALIVAVVVPFPPATLAEASGGSTRSSTWQELYERLREHGDELLDEGAAPMLDGLEFERRVLIDDSPSRGLASIAAEDSPDLLILGSTHRGRLGRVLAGSIATKLLSGGSVAVAVAPRGYAEVDAPSIERICVALDGHRESERALLAAGRLALRHQAVLEVMAIVEPSRSLEYELTGAALKDALEVLAGQGLRDRRGDELRAAAATALDAHAPAVEAKVTVVHGRADELLTALGPDDCDLLVLGSRGYGPLGRTLLGSTSAKVLAGAAVPALVVPRPHEAG